MNKYDIVIVAHEKDFNNIKYIVKQCSVNLNFDSIHLFLSERKEYEDMELLSTITNKPIYKHLETDVLKIDKSRINHRPNWIYQMLLKMLQNVTQNDYLMKHLDYNWYSRESSVSAFWSDNEINNLIEINKEKSTISFHTWGEN